MEKLKIAIKPIGTDATNEVFVRQVYEDSAMLELCTIAYGAENDADAQVLIPIGEPIKCPADATEVVVTEKTCFMPLAKEPAEEDIIKLRDILERDFDARNPRIAIVQEKPMQNQELASQVTIEQGINTYGPYTSEQIQNEDIAYHFDGIIIPEGSTLPTSLSMGAPVRYFAGKEEVVTAIYKPAQKEETEDGLADVSELTHPIYTAIDIVRNRDSYDEARQDPLPKLFRDKREDRRKDEAPQANASNENSENSEQAL